MDFDLTDRQVYWRDRVRDFIERKVRPAVPTYNEQDKAGDRWKVIQIVEDLKAEAKEAGIWNLFMPPKSAAHHHVDETFERSEEHTSELQSLMRISYADF